MAENDSGYALLGDSPILETGRDDALDFHRTAKVLAKAAISTRDPLTIGVFGKWGTGKTSLMRLIWQEVKKENNAAAVWFNAWQYEKEEHLIVPLVATINKELQEKSKTWDEVFRQGAERLRDALRSIAYGFAFKAKAGVPSLIDVEASFSGKEMIERYQALTTDHILGRSLYFDAFEELTKLTKSGGSKNYKLPRIVIFVDDLDRCFPDKAVQLLEGIKLVLHQPGFSFVLGVHDAVIRKFVASKYKKDYNIDFDSADYEDYLEKIVQVEVRVPERQPGQMENFIRQALGEGGLVADLLQNQDISQQELLQLLADGGGCNPRAVVRLLNSLIVTWRIERGKEKKEGEEEVSLLALLIDNIAGKPEYKEFRNDLELKRTGDEKNLGGLLAEAMATDDFKKAENHSTRIDALRVSTKDKGYITLDKYINMLENTRLEHLLNVLKSQAGRKWLSDKVYREKLGEAVRSSVGGSESAADEEESSKASVDFSREIQELLRSLKEIQAGEFNMGSKDYDNEIPIHKVILGAFKISSKPVTQAQYEAVMGKNPSKFQGPKNHPVENVSWNDAMEFCEKLSAKIGEKVTLPTEAQWEYACRAGSETKYCFGDSEEELGNYAWYDKNSASATHPVGEKKPNAWGLYDMHGNVWEWCLDWYGQYPPYSVVDPMGPPSGSHRVRRGGGWFYDVEDCRSANRSRGDPGNRGGILGFRIAAPLVR
ncbi:MAG: SUMF1/EgtB/PvdO family nonheme iron enzyme [Pseudomonadota bacterium]